MKSGVAETYSVGDRVLVAGEAGRVIGDVLAVWTPDQVSEIEGAPPVEQVREILREFEVDLLLLIEHKHNGRDVCFFALRHPGGWRDLRGQNLTIRRIAIGRAKSTRQPDTPLQQGTTYESCQ